MTGPHLLDATMFWPRSGVGGVRRLITTKRAALSARGWRHTLVAPGASGAGMLDCGGWPIPFSGGYRFVADRRHVAQLIERAEPDIIEAADPYTLAWAALDAARALHLPSVAFCHSNLAAMARRWVGELPGQHTRRGRWAERQARQYLARLYGEFELVLAPSRAMTALLHDLGVHHAQHQPLGVDCQVFHPAADDPSWRRALERRLGLEPGTHLLIYAGRFAAEKNLGLLARAVSLLGPGHALLAVGHGPRPPGGRHVHVLPPPPNSAQLARLLASCDAFVHAGDQETFGLGALEAMACGTPVVANASGGLGELVYGAGITLRSQRPEDWADAILGALQHGDTQRRRTALERARGLDWPVVLDMLERRYQRLLQPVRRAGDEPASTAHAHPRHA
ncbi:glycosyltransferase [Ideonella sp.]|uniref:glycosyltransferase n=1 Tax=Ideonella sp. TaxID=1929293 RepID=UPI002B4995F6|nr:glycosyltransferase [Ideonella sp.]HJV71318.1 glycosyltransferase [Ideonella sp.]